MHVPWQLAALFVAHWVLSVGFQTFFLHRYGAHRMFTMSKGWERFFYLCTYVTQGSSFLNPRAYAILHRMHHAYSDTPSDPHSPVTVPNPLKMMNRTRDIYRAIRRGEMQPEARFEGGYPEWPALDRFASRWSSSLSWGALYLLFYAAFATEWWHFLALPVHWLMGPIHGAIVNYFGHKAGYRNFATKDESRNTLPFDFVTMGELFQNNHHTYGSRPNFAVRWWEVDPVWPGIWLLDKLGVIRLRSRRQSAAQPAVSVVPAPDPAE